MLDRLKKLFNRPTSAAASAPVAKPAEPVATDAPKAAKRPAKKATATKSTAAKKPGRPKADPAA